MNCRAAKKIIPLVVGGELSDRKAGGVRRHIETCPSCRAEAEELERARLAVRGMAGACAGGDWSPAEWTQMIREITKNVPRKVESVDATPFRFRPALAGALGVLLAAGVFFLQREIRRPSAPETGSFATISAEARAYGLEPAPSKDPEVKSITIVSPEGGTKIHWFYNKKFEWQGFGK